MPILDYIAGRINRGVITFINMVTLANRSLPYHDYHSDTTTSTYQVHIVGENNQLGRGDQHKLFVSKSTLIFCTTQSYIKLNSAENVVQTLLANTWYEFLSDVSRVHYAYVSAEGTIYIYTEGIDPKEGRRPE